MFSFPSNHFIPLTPSRVISTQISNTMLVPRLAGPPYSEEECALVIALREHHRWSFQRIATYLGGFRAQGSYQVEYSRKLNLSKRGTRVYQLPPGWSLAAADSLSAWRALPPASGVASAVVLSAGSGAAVSTALKRPADEPADSEAPAKRARTAASDEGGDEVASTTSSSSSPPPPPPTTNSPPTTAMKVKAETFLHPATAVDAPAGRTRRATRLAALVYLNSP
jgi:hypothetical protein